MNKKEQERTTKVLEKIRLLNESLDDVEILKSTQGYGYNYADLKSIIDVIKPIMKEHGLWYQHSLRIHPTTFEQIVVTMVYCTDNTDDYIVSETLLSKDAVLPKQNTFMTIGSGITYFRRYHIVAMLGLLTEEDTDAGGKREQPKETGSSQSKAPEKSDGTKLIEQFKSMIKNKRPKEKVEKTLKMYQNQLNNDEIKEINKLISENYEN